MSGGTKETKQTNEPWAAAQPLLKTGISGAQDLFKSGNMFAPYTDSTVVPWSGQTQSGMGAIQGQAENALANGNPLAKPLDFFGSMFDSGGLNQDQQGIADQWRTTASGSELGQVSPAFQKALESVQNSARDATNLSVSGAGRYGSGQHVGALGKAVGDVTNRMMVDEYGRQLGRQDTARTNLAGLGQQGIANQFGASSALPGAWSASQQPAKDLMGVGAMQEDLTGRTMADQLRVWQEQQDQKRKSIEWLTGIGGTMGGMGGTQTGTQPATNPLLQLLGAGVGLSGFFG